MIEDGNYPVGAERDPRAPWNDEPVPEKQFYLTVSQTLSKSVLVKTNEYEKELKDTNWKSIYANTGHYTPLDLISIFKSYLQMVMMGDFIDSKTKQRYKHLIEECGRWTNDELEVIQD